VISGSVDIAGMANPFAPIKGSQNEKIKIQVESTD